MMGEIQVLPSTGSASTTTAAASTSSVTPNGSITLGAKVVDAATGTATPTGSVPFQINGSNVGNPVTVDNGQATLTTTINGNSGANSVTAFYQGDYTYAESVSTAVPLTISNFALSSPGAMAALGVAAIANVTVNVADRYTSPISFSCTMPSTLTESACFVDPNSMTGSGQINLRVNTTPAHPTSSMRKASPGWLAAGGGSSLACLILLVSPRRRWRAQWLLVLGLATALFMVVGCSGAAASDPGTAKGSYTVVVTATSGSGSAQFQTSANVLINIQ